MKAITARVSAVVELRNAVLRNAVVAAVAVVVSRRGGMDFSDGSSVWSTIEAAVKAIANGRFVVVVDDEGREDEGDLVLAAQ